MDGRPSCDCHGEPMQWARNRELVAGGRWRCRVALDASTQRWRVRNPERVREANFRTNGWKRDQARAAIAEERAERGGACLDCGTGGPLEWHHRDPSTKLFNVTELAVYGERLLTELDKCDLLCPGCHRLRHVVLRAEGTSAVA